MRAHIVLGALFGQHASQAEQAVLGGDIGRFQRRGLVRVHRTHVDHHAAAVVLVHMLECGLGGQEGTVDVDRHDLFPIRVRVVLDRVDDLDPGIGDQDVDRTEFGRHLVHPGIDRILVGDVHYQSDRTATRLGDLCRHGVGAVQVQVGDRDRRARVGKGQCNFLADAAGRACDDSDLTFQSSIRNRWIG